MKEKCKKCLKINKECLIEIGACPITDYGLDISTATYEELKKQNNTILNENDE